MDRAIFNKAKESYLLKQMEGIFAAYNDSLLMDKTAKGQSEALHRFHDSVQKLFEFNELMNQYCKEKLPE